MELIESGEWLIGAEKYEKILMQSRLQLVQNLQFFVCSWKLKFQKLTKNLGLICTQQIFKYLTPT